MVVVDREHPCRVHLVERTRLSGVGSAKDVYRLVFDAEGLEYLPGDSLAIFPKNDPVVVEELLRLLGFDGEERVSIKNLDSDVRHALLEKFCIEHLPKRFFGAFQERLIDSDHEQFSKIFAPNLNQCSLLELVKNFPKVRFSPDELCTLLKKSVPRFYSIASARTSQKEKIHLIINTVKYKDFLENTRYGVASGYLNHRLPVGESVDAYVSRSAFKPPLDGPRDLIMVGPGTGLAPFLSFLRHFEAKFLANEPIGRMWLFFGDQHEATDFIERDEIMRLLNSNVLTRLSLAFSRDQDKKIYVQDRMWDAREELWNWLANGASFYVCGDASRMAVDVENMLKHIASVCGNLEENAVENWLTESRTHGRYQRDVY